MLLKIIIIIPIIIEPRKYRSLEQEKERKKFNFFKKSFFEGNLFEGKKSIIMMIIIIVRFYILCSIIWIYRQQFEYLSI